MNNVEQNENSPVEIIEGRLKRLHMNEIDARKRLKLREEEGGRAEKQRQLGRGNNEYLVEETPVEIIEEKSKDFTRVGWILNYRPWLQEEKGVGFWEKENN